MVFFCPFWLGLSTPGTCTFARRRKAYTRPIAYELMRCLAPLGGEVDGGQPVAELGIAHLAASPRRLDQRPRLRVGEHGLKHEAVQPVTATNRPEGAKDGRAGKRKIA